MRNPKRIPIALKLLFQNKILYKFLGTDTPGWSKKLHENWDLIENEWKENPDQRFGQLLSNLGLVTKEIEDHIKNIIKFFEKYSTIDRIPKNYLEYFNKRIEKNE